MGDLVPRSGAGKTVAHQFGPAIAGTGRAVEDTTWNGDVIDFDEFAALPRLVGGSPVAEAVTDDGLVRRRRQGPAELYFRRRVGFRAWPSEIVVVVREQPLAPRADGRMSIRGPYGPPVVSRRLAAEPAVRRIGDVPVDPPDPTPPAGDPSSDRRHRRAFDQLAFLPAPVRRSVLQRAPAPTHFIAEAIRLDPSSAAPCHRVSVLRMDEHTAIVVVGSRQHRARHWQVDQRTYVLTPGSTLPATAHR
jgi:hypothetical protein